MHKAGRGSERGLGTSMDNTLPDYCPWYRVTKYLESLRVVRWRDTATMYAGAKNKYVLTVSEATRPTYLASFPGQSRAHRIRDL